MLRRAAWRVASLVPVAVVMRDHVCGLHVEAGPRAAVHLVARGTTMRVLAPPRTGRVAELAAPDSCAGEHVLVRVVNDGSVVTRAAAGAGLRVRPGYIWTEGFGVVPRSLVAGVVVASWTAAGLVV